MSVSFSGRGIDSGSLFLFDTYNIKSYIGEPTTNLVQQISNYTGTNYASSTEWSSDPTRFSKTYNSTIDTPIGTGATLCAETGTAGFHHLSTLGGSGENASHSISCYVYPLTSITNFTIGMLNDTSNQVTFNLNTREITYGGGISNRNAFCNTVSGFPGWLRVGANIEGRFGGWVGCVGLSTGTSYTPSTPYKSFYITGLQYEYKDHCTPYVFGSRSNTQGLIDLESNKYSIDLTGAAFNKNAEIIYDGSTSWLNVGSINMGNKFTIETVFKPQNVSGDLVLVGSSANGCDNWFGITSKLRAFVTEIADVNNVNYDANTTLVINNWYHGVMTVDTNLVNLYLNGKNDSSNTTAFTIGSWNAGLSIGRRCPDLAQRYFTGSIDYVRIYNRALSATEVLKSFNRVKSRYGL
jgi:hypothetical protein